MRTACVPDFLSDCFLAEPAEPERGGHGPARRMPLPAEGPDGGDMADMIAATLAGIPLPRFHGLLPTGRRRLSSAPPPGRQRRRGGRSRSSPALPPSPGPAFERLTDDQGLSESRGREASAKAASEFSARACADALERAWASIPPSGRSMDAADE